MNLYTKDTIQLTNYDRQDCKDLHSWGPGARTCYIIHYVIRGSGYLECDSHCYHISAGESFLICPYVMIHYYPDPEDPWEYTWIDFIGKEADSYLSDCVMSRFQPVAPALPASRILPLYERLRGLDIFSADSLEANGILLAILGLYADSFPSSQKAVFSSENNRLATAVSLIQSSYHDPAFQINTLCQTLHWNRSSLHRLFRRCLHTSPGKYLTDYRLRQACLLLQIGMSVKSTTFSCGFTDQFYFSRIFKKRMGVPPSEYRKMCSTSSHYVNLQSDPIRPNT